MEQRFWLSRAWKSATYFAFANAAASACHYFFQLIAARNLDVVSFGALTTWIAQISIGFILGSIAQIAANFLPLRRSHLLQLCGATLVLGFGLTGLYIYSASPVPSPLFTGGTIFLATLFMWLIGQLQSRLLFFAVGTALLVSAGAKLATVVLVAHSPSSEATFYWAFWMSFVLPIGLILLFVVLSSNGTEATQKLSLADIQKRLLATTALATAATLIPQIDILIAHRLLLPEELGEFSRVSLFYKAGYFGLAILAQWLLPHQIQKSDSSTRFANWILILFVAGVAGAGLASALGPYAASFLLKFSLDHLRPWIFLSCLNMSAMIALYFFIQTDCSRLLLKRPAVVISCVGLANLIWLFVSPNMTQFLVSMSATNVALVFGVYVHHIKTMKAHR